MSCIVLRYWYKMELEVVSIKQPGTGKQCFFKMAAKRLKQWCPCSLGFEPVHPSTFCENLVEICQTVLKLERSQTFKKKTQRKQQKKFFRAVTNLDHTLYREMVNCESNKWGPAASMLLVIASVYIRTLQIKQKKNWIVMFDFFSGVEKYKCNSKLFLWRS